MIINNLLLKLKDRRPENIAKTRDVLLGMKGKIEFIRDLQVEVDIRHSEKSWDIALIGKFASMEDFKAYVAHPAHVEVSQYIAGVLETAAAVCYEN